MKKISIFILFLFLTLVLGNTEYGNYCGIDLESKEFSEPIDNLDRLCQIYIICQSAYVGYTPCVCDEQMYGYVTLLSTTSEQQSFKDHILSKLYAQIATCKNYNNLGKKLILGNKWNKRNFIPFYSYSNQNKYVMITPYSGLEYHIMSKTEYNKFIKKQSYISTLVYDFSYVIKIENDQVLVALSTFNDDKITYVIVDELDKNISSIMDDSINVISAGIVFTYISLAISISIAIITTIIAIVVYKRYKKSKKHNYQILNQIELEQ